MDELNGDLRRLEEMALRQQQQQPQQVVAAERDQLRQ